MALYRMQSVFNDAEDLAADAVTNTLYFADSGVGGVQGTDPQGLVDDLLAIWLAQPTLHAGMTSCTVKAYEMHEAEPRLPVAEAVGTFASPGAKNAPREIALCLSFAGEKSTPRTRGRIYLGPISSPTSVRPLLAVTTAALDLADAFSGLGGLDVDWVIFSPTNGAANVDDGVTRVKKSWVDDEWDTQRRRGLAPTTRTERTHDE